MRCRAFVIQGFPLTGKLAPKVTEGVYVCRDFLFKRKVFTNLHLIHQRALVPLPRQGEGLVLEKTITGQFYKTPFQHNAHRTF